jgi:hypothetical protein
MSTYILRNLIINENCLILATAVVVSIITDNNPAFLILIKIEHLTNPPNILKILF